MHLKYSLSYVPLQHDMYKIICSKHNLKHLKKV